VRLNGQGQPQEAPALLKSLKPGCWALAARRPPGLATKPLVVDQAATGPASIAALSSALSVHNALLKRPSTRCRQRPTKNFSKFHSTSSARL